MCDSIKCQINFKSCIPALFGIESYYLVYTIYFIKDMLKRVALFLTVIANMHCLVIFAISIASCN